MRKKIILYNKKDRTRRLFLLTSSILASTRQTAKNFLQISKPFVCVRERDPSHVIICIDHCFTSVCFSYFAESTGVPAFPDTAARIAGKVPSVPGTVDPLVKMEGLAGKTMPILWHSLENWQILYKLAHDKRSFSGEPYFWIYVAYFMHAYWSWSREKFNLL